MGMQGFEGFNPPIHTQTPNELFDDLLPQIESMAELKVLLVAIRKTLGWHKESDVISLSQFVQATGMARETVSTGIKLCLTRGTLRRVASGQSFAYQLVIQPAVGESAQVVGISDQSTHTTSRNIRPLEPESSRNIRPKVVGISDTQKKYKETIDSEKEKVLSPNGDNSTPSLMEGQRFFLETFGKKRFGTNAEKQVIGDLERDVGLEVTKKAITWAAQSNIHRVTSIRTAALKMAKGGPKENGYAEAKRGNPASKKYAGIGTEHRI